MADPTSPCSDPRSCPCTAELAGLRSEIDALRATLAEEVSTAVLRATEVRAERVVVAEPDGFERVRLTAEGDHGHVVVRSRGAAGDATQVDVFALDAEDDADRPYVGVELVDRGTTTAGLALYESRTPRLWTSL